MAITNNNVGNVKFLRNGSLYGTHDAAYAALTGFTLTSEQDGTIILARYGSGDEVKTLAGLVYYTTSGHSMTIIDIEGASGDVNELRQEINAKLGEGVSSANTVTAQLTALSGNNQSTSAETSVEGAKRYAEDLISELDGGVTAETGYYVKSVSEVDGKISGATEALPTVNDTAVAKKFVTKVDQTNGEISVSRGEITSSAKTIVLNDNADGGIDFDVNIDGVTLEKDEDGVISVTSSALVQYEGDDDTIQISAVSDGVRTVSSPLTIQKVTTGLSEEVKEEYHLVGHSGTTIGDPIKIYKDSHIASITYITNTGDTHYQNLEYVYIDASGKTQTTYVDMSELVLEAEFASGVTITDHVAHGVVDPTSEADSNNVAFLTVGEDGFKVSGIKDEIDRQLDAVVEDLDATVTGATSGSHITISIEELDGKLVQSGLTIEENDIASASDLEELSAKTVSEIASSNASISATSTATDDGTVGYDLVTDASKIKMTGFTAAESGLTTITSASTVTEAVKAIETEILANEETVSNALNDLDGRLDVIESGYVETVKVNNVALAETDNAVNVQISGATSAMTGANAVIVETDNTGAVTIGLGTIDCGTY